ncbi:MAG: hypothetical protein IPM55_01365 [Acidobacteria bacterium]|nr:hypothetical protein [Acidobacteriota bacterium]
MLKPCWINFSSADQTDSACKPGFNTTVKISYIRHVWPFRSLFPSIHHSR